jgi:hypothetical protein
MNEKNKKSLVLFLSLFFYLGMIVLAILVFITNVWYELIIYGFAFVVFLFMIFLMPKIILLEEFNE